jgi:Tfp pilus assembly PilM family ATPase/Tfp pilus assembly protein PilN
MLVLILSPKRVTAAEVQSVDGELHVSAVGGIEVPEGAFAEGNIVEGELLGEAVSEFVAVNQVIARRTVMVLPEGSAITQLIKLPSMPREDMLGAVRAVAERYALFAEHTVAVDCSVAEEFEQDGSQMSNVLLAATWLANVEQCQECARAAGLELVSVEALPVVAARAYGKRLQGSEAVALAVVGEAKTDVMIFDDGVLRLCYSANAGLPEQTEQGEWISPAPEQHDPFTPPPQLYSELTHCFRFFQNQFPRSAVQRVLIAADHPRAEEIASYLAEQLQLPVELGRPDQAVRLPEQTDAQRAAKGRALSLALLRGSVLADESQGEVLFPLNLVPKVSSGWRLALPYVKLGAVAAAVLLVASLLWAWSLGNRIAVQERKLGLARAEIVRLQPELEAIREAEAAELALFTQVERQTARIAKERAVRWSQILVDVAARLPKDMWLTRMASPDSSRIVLNGIATNRETIPGAIESLSESPYLNSVVLGSLSKDDTYRPARVVIRYQINARLLRGMLAPASASTTEAVGEEQ